jgi:hypothetical protein
MAGTLQATPPGVDLLLCDSETALQKVSWWIGSGPRTTLAGDANADIMTTIVECVRERVMRGYTEENPSMNELTLMLKMHDSYHQKVDNGQLALLE